MILNSIEIKNIRSYNDEKIELPRGITLFEGDVGSGKSSVLMAIEFALFGLGSQKPEALLSKKATEGHVILTFEVEGKKYEVRRTLRRKGDSVSQDSKTSYLISDGIEEPLAATELKQRIMQILKFNEPAGATSESRIYRYAVFTPQEEMKQVLRDSSKRLETIRKAFGIENYKTAAENAKSLISLLHTRIEVYKEQFAYLDNSRTQFENVKEILVKLEKEISDLEIQKTNTLTEQEEAKKTLEKTRKNQNDKQKLEQEKTNSEEKVEDYNSDIESFLDEIGEKTMEIERVQEEIIEMKKIKKPTSKSLSRLDKEISKFEDLQTKIREAKTSIGPLQKEVARLSNKLGIFTKGDLRVLEKEKTELEKSLSTQNSKLDELVGSIEGRSTAKAKLEDRIEDFEAKLNDVLKLGEKCPVCDNKLTPVHIEKLKKERKEKLKKYKDELESLTDDIRKVKSEKDDLESAISKTEDRVSELEKVMPLLNERNEKNEELQKLEQTLADREPIFKIREEKLFPNEGGRYKDPVSYLRAMRDALISYGNTASKIKTEQSRIKSIQKNIDSLKEKKSDKEKKISETQNKIEGILKKIDAFGDVDDQFNKSQHAFDQISEQIMGLEKMLSAKNEGLNSQKREMQRIKNEIEEAEKSRSLYEKFSDYYNWLNDYFIPTIDMIEKQVLLSIQQQFNMIYQNWFSVLIDDPTKQTRIDEGFTPIIEQDGYEQDVEYLSGGEKTSIALAYRLALNSMMRQETESLKSNLLILDEPTDGFSKSQLSKVKSILQDLHSQQIILVSHEKELETYVDNIFQITKDEGFSHVTRMN